MEAKVVNAIPAMSYELHVALKDKVSTRELESVREEKASLVIVEALVKRLNKIEETIMAGGLQTRPKTSQKINNDKEDAESEF